ncbi:mRNA interferase YafQ [Moraxella caprae]|uniref:mRNA interferase YafQ n=1 Tax=Moraxella caprae TaxID=90240 RepID=A0A378R075_9GAMM|nr:type II toxin-antitoxin system YafQ family toxin [Moraxella caprae]STZ08021.1 mRNA interferase YafQ [Moraxella caprae]
MAKRSFEMGNPFKRDLKKHYLALIGEAWMEVSDCLLNAKPIPKKYQDHPLQGDWVGFRDCHIKPDLVLIYKINDEVVELHRLATHSELFG